MEETVVGQQQGSGTSKQAAAIQARNAANKRLIEAHREEYVGILNEERKSRGLSSSGMAKKRERVEAQIARLKELGLDTSALTSQLDSINW